MASSSRISCRSALSSRCSVQPSVPATPGFVYRGQPHTTRNVHAGMAPTHDSFSTVVCQAVIVPASMAPLTGPDRSDFEGTSSSVHLYSVRQLFIIKGNHMSQYHALSSLAQMHICKRMPWCRGICSRQRRRCSEQRSTATRTSPATIRSDILLRRETCRVVQRGDILQQPVASGSPRCS